jgi:hypothetical protein
MELTDGVLVGVEDRGYSMAYSIKDVMGLFGEGAFYVEVPTHFIDEHNGMSKSTSGRDRK